MRVHILACLLVGLLPAATEERVPPVQALHWSPLTGAAAFSPRDTAEGVIFRDRLLLSNGYYHGNVLHRDLWASQDGVVWEQVSDATPYDGYSELVVFKNALWAVKGSVWRSEDGEKWTQVLAETPFGVRGYGETVVFQGALWQLGSGPDIWRSIDGVAWTQVVENVPWGDRSAAAVEVFDGKLWLMGGTSPGANDPPEQGYKDTTTFNDVWRSADGVTWERMLEHAPWSPRQWFPAVAYRDRLWILGGYDNVNNTNVGDVWSTADGTTWERLDATPAPAPRHEPTLYVHKGRLLVVAGNTWPVVNDVWELTPTK